MSPATILAIAGAAGVALQQRWRARGSWASTEDAVMANLARLLLSEDEDLRDQGAILYESLRGQVDLRVLLGELLRPELAGLLVLPGGYDEDYAEPDMEVTTVTPSPGTGVLGFHEVFGFGEDVWVVYKIILRDNSRSGGFIFTQERTLAVGAMKATEENLKKLSCADLSKELAGWPGRDSPEYLPLGEFRNACKEWVRAIRQSVAYQSRQRPGLTETTLEDQIQDVRDFVTLRRGGSPD